MKSNAWQVQGGRALVLTCSCLLLVSAAAWGAGAGERVQTAAELLRIARNPNQNPIARSNAIGKLGELTEAGPLRDYKVVDELLAIAKLDTAKPDDIFVRISAIGALGKLYLVDKVIKEKYIGPLTTILKDQKEHMLVRVAVAEVFKDTLVNDPKEHADIEAHTALLDVVKNKLDVTALRCAAIRAVGVFGSSQSLEPLTALLSDQDAMLRETAAGALGDLLKSLGITQLSVPTVNKLIEMVSDKKMAPELRVNVMLVLAQLIREAQQQAKQTMPVIIGVVKNEKDMKLVKGGIEALGIIGTAEAVEPLKVAYGDFQQPAAAAKADPDAPAAANTAAEAERNEFAEIRRKIMEALVTVLSFQQSRNQPELKAVHEVALLLVKAVDDDPAATVRSDAVFAMRYLYPVKFKAEHKEVIDS
ncbi:MAG: HEAT repeat domain-containing protein, partial [Planctomycetota bacterium]